MAISFIIVNYASEKFLRRCLASIVRHAPAATYETIVVNNDALALSDIPGVKIIEMKENGGFAKACNAGATTAVGEILFFLNPDTEILTDIDIIAGSLRDPAVGVAAPRLVTSSGAVQPWSSGYEMTPLDTLLDNLSYTKSRRLWTGASPDKVAWVSGAALAISKGLFTKCGGFDEKFFMYFEDVDLCRRVRQLGKKILVLPGAEILHIGGQSIPDANEQKKYYYASQDRYFQKHFHPLSAFFIKLLRKTFLLFKN